MAALLACFAGAPAFAQTAVITGSSPATLNQSNLRGATVNVFLSSSTYASDADVSHFTLTTTIPGLTIHSVAFDSARTVATLRLHYDGSDFDAAATIAFTVAAAGTSHNAALTTSTQAVSPARWVNVSKKTIALAEGGSANSYTVVLESPPTASVTVAVTSDNAAVTVDTDATPLTRSLTFTTTTWNTAQTVTVTPVDDNTDAHDELALVTNVATGGGYASSTVANRTVRVTVADDEQTGTDYDVDDDQLIEIDSLAKLNAVRWDLDGNGAVAAGNATAYATAFPSAATGMGCPDGGDSNQTPDGCRGYELTANLDFDTDGDGATHVNGAGDSGDDYYNSNSGWDPIGGNTSTTRYEAVFRGNGHVIRNLFVRLPSSVITYAGLFSLVGGSGRIESLGLRDVYAWTNYGYAGAVMGWSYGQLVGCYSTGTVVVALGPITEHRRAGGLVGQLTSGATAGGGSIAASYSTAMASAPAVTSQSGGLTGRSYHSSGVGITIQSSWAAGRATGTTTGGLIGAVSGTAPTVTDNYYDTQATGQTDSRGGLGLSTAALQGPTGYTGIYAFWDDLDLDGDGRVDADDDAWDFGTSSQYPSLKWGGFDPTTQFAVPPPMSDEPQETTEAPTGAPTEVRAEARAQSLLVTWRAVAGATAYRVQYRVAGQAWSSSRQAETTETRYEIAGLSDGVYEVRVLAVIDGAVGEPSAAVQGEVGTPGNRPPSARGIADVELDIDETAEVDLDAAFEDPDGDTLRYTVAVDGNAVEARVSGATLRLRGRLAGEATVTATATDPDGQSASASFTAQVGAVLSLHGSPAAPEGGVVALQVELSRPLATDVEVGWRLAADDNPATADADEADFGAWAGTMTFAAGETRTQIAVAVLDDDAIEPARERFAVELEQPEDSNVGLSARAWRVVGSVQEGVCDRTPAVRAELSQGWRECRWPRPSDLSRRTTLDIRGHGASALHADDLLGLSQLRTLDLGGNALSELPAGLLRHAPRLRSLRLDGNRLASLPAGLFAALSADTAGLRELRLVDNPGAPFALTPTLRRTDAEPWTAGPATIEAALPLGAPFTLRLALSVAGGEATAEALTLTAGSVASDAVRISGDGPVRVLLAAPTIPQTRCGDAPCFDGLAAQGAALALFAAPPRVSVQVSAAELLGGGDAVRIDLSAHFAASAAGGALSYTATVDDPRLATVLVEGSVLTVAANEDREEGTVAITVVATDDLGQTATLRFEVNVSPPSTRWRGWRSTVAAPAAE